jgi:hypothetical protein
LKSVVLVQNQISAENISTLQIAGDNEANKKANNSRPPLLSSLLNPVGCNVAPENYSRASTPATA